MKILLLIPFLLSLHCHKGSAPEAEVKATYLKTRLAPFEVIFKWRGTVRAANRIEIRTDRKIKIKKVLAANFDNVKKGQSLIEVDNSETQNKFNDLVEKKKTFALELESVKLKNTYALKVLHRKKALLDKGIIAAKEHDDALKDSKISETELKTKLLERGRQERELNEIELQLKTLVFRAPMDGAISNLLALENAQNAEVQPGQLLGMVSDTSSLAVWVPVEETHIHRVSNGMKAKVLLDAYPGETLEGSVIEVSSNPVQNSGRTKQYEVGVVFPSTGKDLKEGYGGEVTFLFDRKDKAIAVPLSALKYSDGKNFVSVASSEGKEGKPREVTVGLKTEIEAEVSKGLQENEVLVVDAQ